MATELLLCQMLDDFPDGDKVGDRTIVRHIHSQHQAFLDRSNLVNLEQVWKDSLAKGCVHEIGQKRSIDIRTALQKWRRHQVEWWCWYAMDGKDNLLNADADEVCQDGRHTMNQGGGWCKVPDMMMSWILIGDPRQFVWEEVAEPAADKLALLSAFSGGSFVGVEQFSDQHSISTFIAIDVRQLCCVEVPPRCFNCIIGTSGSSMEGQPGDFWARSTIATLE